MNATTLVQKLIEIELAIGVKDATTIRGMLMDAQNSVLWLQKDLVAYLHTKPGLASARPSL